jgi:RNA polymerase sigma-70 factor (ECF subfamily)
MLERQVALPLGELLNVDEAQRAVANEDDWRELVRCIGTRDLLALHRLYERSHQPVFTLAFRITRDREVAEETTLDVFDDVWHRARFYDPADGTVLSWLMRLARDRSIERAHGSNFPAAVAEQRRFLRLVFSVLTFAERRAIEATFFARRSYDEAALSLDETPETVRTRLRIALQKLQRVLAERPSPG